MSAGSVALWVVDYKFKLYSVIKRCFILLSQLAATSQML